MPDLDNAVTGLSRSAPLGVAWGECRPGITRAGVNSVVQLVLRNTGAATWRTRGDIGVRVSYHWLDELGHPFVWDSPRTPLPHPVAPGEAVEISVVVRAPTPPGTYILAFDLVEEHQFWFSEIGLPMLEILCQVQPRISDRRLGVVIHPGSGDEAATRAALGQQFEPIVTSEASALAHLVAGCVPAADWSSRVLDAHAEGYAAVGTAIVPHRRDRSLAPWNERGGRNRRFPLPLLLPSLLEAVDPSEHLGLPAYTGPDGLFDGRTSIRLPPRSDRRRR